ncbi:MAG: hypothetical protein P8O06_00085 [Porticoccaceae bacterium]|nr:hypothetical protein [Porticoccaceae bacterium]
MLGPEQLNMVPRLSPVSMESVTVVRVSEQLARDVGLADNQVIRGIIASRNGAAVLLLNNRELEWAAGKRFKEGDRIDFRVESTSNGKTLRPVAVHHAATLAAPVAGSVVATSPRLLNLLYRPDQPSIQAALFQPGAMQAFLSQIGDAGVTQRLSQLLLSMANVSPDNIRQALVASGLFGEFFLSRQMQSRLDVKQLMRKLLVDGKLTPELKVSVGQLVDEIEGNQIEGLQARQSQQISYHFVIPFNDANPVEVDFERGVAKEDGGSSDWVINLHTDSEDLGPLWLKTTVKANKEIDMILWASWSDSASKAETASTILQQSLQGFDLTLTKLTVLNAARPSIDSSLTGPGQVLDVST